MENRSKVEILFKRYTDGEASEEEVKSLISYIQSIEKADEINHLIEEVLANEPSIDQLKNLDSLKRIRDTRANLLQVIKQNQPTTRNHKMFTWISIAAAAAIIVAASFLFIYKSGQVELHKNNVIALDVLPGTNKAVLTLANGKKISLTDAKKGLLENQTGITITKTTDGQIVYAAAQNNTANNNYNTVETPNGGEYRVTLPDGTKVWLNAASSLKYPTTFGALKERRVELSGEAYFEVAHNKAQPFRVVSNGQTVEVLGTHFNINSYADEKKITTTLAEGSVKVYTGNQSKIIKPGEQTLLSKNGEITVEEADLQTALAWKNGKILFKDADIKTIMRQAARWYDIDIAFEGNIAERAFNGGVARTANLSSLLKILELNNIHFSMEQNGSRKKLIVKP